MDDDAAVDADDLLLSHAASVRSAHQAILLLSFPLLMFLQAGPETNLKAGPPEYHNREGLVQNRALQIASCSNELFSTLTPVCFVS